MFNFIIGIAVGAAFAPFWMKVWNQIKAWWATFSTKK